MGPQPSSSNSHDDLGSLPLLLNSSTVDSSRRLTPSRSFRFGFPPVWRTQFDEMNSSGWRDELLAWTLVAADETSERSLISVLQRSAVVISRERHSQWREHLAFMTVADPSRLEQDSGSDHYELDRRIKVPQIVGVRRDHPLSSPTGADDDMRIDHICRTAGCE